MRDVDDETFELEVVQAGRPVVVDFWAPWCGPCRGVTRVLDELASEYGDAVDFVKVDVDASPSSAARAEVFALPTVVLWVDGAVRGTLVGSRPREHYERAFGPWLAARPAG